MRAQLAWRCYGTRCIGIGHHAIARLFYREQNWESLPSKMLHVSSRFGVVAVVARDSSMGVEVVDRLRSFTFRCVCVAGRRGGSGIHMVIVASCAWSANNLP